MIDHKNHYDRYDALISLVSSGNSSRRKDGGYMAALYILSADVEISRLACSCVGGFCIDFKRLLTAARKSEATTSQLTAIKTAHSLFNQGSVTVTPCDLAQCDYDTLDILTAALYIWKGGRAPSCDCSCQMFLDNSAEQRSRSIEAEMNTLFASMQQAAE